MELLRFGYARLKGQRNTQYLLANPEADKHKAISEYLGFFGFGFDPYLPEELQSKRFIQIPITSSSGEDTTFLARVLNAIAVKYTVDPGCIYALDKACDSIISLQDFRWVQHNEVFRKNFTFSVFYGFDLDGSNFLYLIFDNNLDIEDTYERYGFKVYNCDAHDFTSRFKFYAPTQPAGVSLSHLNMILSAFVKQGPTTTNMQRYSRAEDKFNANLERYLQANDIAKPNQVYLDFLSEAIEKLYK